LQRISLDIGEKNPPVGAATLDVNYRTVLEERLIVLSESFRSDANPWFAQVAP